MYNISINEVLIAKETIMPYLPKLCEINMPMLCRLRYAFERCTELLETHIRETQDGQDICDCGDEDCSNSAYYDNSLPFKRQDAAVACFLIDEWLADNDNIHDEIVQQNLVALLRYCSGYAANHNPLMKLMFDGLIMDLQANDDDDGQVKTQSRKGLH